MARPICSVFTNRLGRASSSMEKKVDIEKKKKCDDKAKRRRVVTNLTMQLYPAQQATCEPVRIQKTHYLYRPAVLTWTHLIGEPFLLHHKDAVMMTV